MKGKMDIVSSKHIPRNYETIHTFKSVVTVKLFLIVFNTTVSIYFFVNLSMYK